MDVMFNLTVHVVPTSNRSYLKVMQGIRQSQKPGMTAVAKILTVVGAA
jgi:hypothetical protein